MKAHIVIIGKFLIAVFYLICLFFLTILVGDVAIHILSIPINVGYGQAFVVGLLSLFVFILTFNVLGMLISLYTELLRKERNK